jgi:hypothetical protein
MDTVTWIDTLEAAKVFDLRQRRQFLSYMDMRGFWDAKAQAPTPKAFDLAIVRAGAKADEWQWDEGFVQTFRAYDASATESEAAGRWNPHRCCSRFRDGLQSMFRTPRPADPARAELRDTVYRQLQQFRFEGVIADVCRYRGVSAAVERGVGALKAALHVLDKGHSSVRNGAVSAWTALDELSKLDGDHPYVLYGIIPESETTPSLPPLGLSSTPVPATEAREPSEWEKACALARSLGYPEPAAPTAATNDDLLTVWEGGRPIALIDRKGMRWRSALTRILETGQLGESPEGDHAARAEKCTFRKVAANASYTQPVLVAGRRARGTAPTSDRTKERYLSLLDWMRAEADDHPLPALESDARKVVDALGDLYGTRKREGTLPASEKQVAYAQDLAKQHGIEATFDRTSTRKEVGDFLDAMRKAEEARGMVAKAGPEPSPSLMKP